MKLQKTVSRILDGLILLVFILFFASAGFQDRNTSGWYQQWLPNLNGSTITDIIFLDSLTGFAVTNPGTSIYCYILKTSNGGDNWAINYTYNSGANIKFTRIQFADNNTGYVSTNFYNFFKTTDSGLTWSDYPNVPFGAEDMSVVNRDSILVVTSRGLGGGVYRSTNGGLNWQYIWNNSPNGNPDKIYMYDKNLGFTQNGSNYMRRTTNGGFNWDLVSGEFFTSVKFLDSNTGWKVYDSIKITTNGGTNWMAQKTPTYSSGFGNNTSFAISNKDTVWMVGAEKLGRPPVFKTTNGGLNWGYQLPDTNLSVYYFDFIQFVDVKYGWVHPGFRNNLYHTKIGGNDTTFITNINNSIINMLSNYQLFQNYPNPFNSRTVIRCQLFRHSGRTERAGNSNVSIKVYDVQGREVQTLVQGKLNPGIYEYIFNGSNLSSGIYFYSMIIDGTVVDTKKMMYIR